MNRERNFLGKTAIAAVQYGKEGEYWLKKFSGELQKTSFPYDHPISKSQTGEEKRDTVEFEFTPAAVSKLLELSKGLAHRLYIILAANLVVLLYKYTGNKDIIIGSPILKQEIEGDFINTALALRNQLNGDITFKELLLDMVRPTITEANQHQNYPLETLLFQLNMPIHQGDFPLFDVVILLENIHETKYIRYTSPNIIFSFLLTENSLKGKVIYNPLLYQRTSAEKLANHFKRLMEEIAFNIDMPVSRLEILSPEEKRQLLVDFNDTRTSYPHGKTITGLFAEQAVHTPDQIALTLESESTTYKQLYEDACKLASYLHFLGVTPEEPVALMVENSSRVIVAILGILKAGGAYLPINIDYPEQRKKYILTDCCVKRILTNIEVTKLDPGITWIPLDNPVIYQYPSQSKTNFIEESRADNLAYIMYTSGSTGAPKGVIVKHRNVIRLVKNTNYIRFEKGDSILLTGALEFDASTFEIWGALLNGLTLHLLTKEILLNHYQLKQTIIKNNITTMWMTSPLFNQMLDADIEIFKGLKNLLVGGDVLSPHHINRLRARFPRINVINGYGPTENTTFSITHLITREYKENIPIGKPISNSTAYILDSHLHLVPIGIVGDLFVGGDGVSRGYLNMPELTIEKFIINPFETGMYPKGRRLYATGDLARWLPDGKIEFLGRRDHQVKIRGYRIELGEIENHLMKIEGIHEAVVINGKNNDEEKYLCAYIVGKAAGERQNVIDAVELKRKLLNHLPEYMVPAFFMQLDEIPLTPNGKVDRKALPKSEVQGAGLYLAPRNLMEKKFVEIWSEVLKIDRDKISIDSDFFELGGHSLRATILISKLHKAFNLKIPLAELFKTPTIRELSVYIQKLTTQHFSAIKSAEKKEYYELSAAQKRIYILQQLELTGTSYNIPNTFMIEGQLDREKLEKTFRKLIDRHEGFKTSFELVKEKPVQKINQPVDFHIMYSQLTINDKKEEIISNFEKPFDLSQAPLIRVELVRLAPGQEDRNPLHILMVDIHHIITDGTSMELLVEEFKAYYAGENLSPIRLQYIDYAEWQNSKEQKEAIKHQETYWQKQFAGEIPVLNLPVDFSRPAIQSFAGNIIGSQLDLRQTHTLNALALEQGVSLYILLLTMTNVFLSKLSNQEDIVIGTPIAARRHADLEPIIGMFVNTMAMRNYPVGSKTFRDFLHEVKERTLEAFENQEYQFEDLVEKVLVNRDASRNPLFDFALSLPNMEAQTGGIPRVETSSLNIRPYESESRISKFDMTFTFLDGSDTLQWRIEYCTRLFKKETVEQYNDYFKQIAAAVLAGGLDKKIAMIEMVSESQKKRLLFDFNNTEADYPAAATIHELFAEQVERTPDRTALVGKSGAIQADANTFGQDGHLSYGKLNEKSSLLARDLKEKGVKPDTIVGIMVERSIGMIIGIFGILKAGGAYLPIDPEHPGERINYILNDSSAAVLVSGSSLTEERKKVRGFEDKIILLEEFAETPRCSTALLPYPPSIPPSTHSDLLPASVPAGPSSTSTPTPTPTSISTSTLTLTSSHRVIPENLAYIIYTSGSTGKPKGVMVQHGSVVNRLNWMQRAYPIREDDIILQKTPFTFDVSVWELFWWSIRGALLCLLTPPEEKNPRAIVNAIAGSHVTIMHFVPSMMNAFLEYVEEQGPQDINALSSLKQVFSSGEELTVRQVERFDTLLNQANKTKLANLYGPTEATVDVSFFDCPPGEKLTKVPIGKPIDNIQFYVVDKQTNLQPVGIPGELGIGGVGVSRGYLNRPELTAEKFIGNPYEANERLYLTGDLTRWHPGGNLEYLGRIDYQVKIRGFRVELEEIKNQLLKHPVVKEAVVIARNDGQGDTYLCAYVVMTGTGKEETERTAELKRYLSQSLPLYMIPAYFMPMEKVPFTPSGKIDRKALPDPIITSSRKYVAPRDAVERKMVEIWWEILDRKGLPIGIDDHFFELGGHSLKATIMIAKIHKELKARLPLGEVFKTPTIRALVQYIKKTIVYQYTSIEPVEKKEYYPLSPAQKRLYTFQHLEIKSTVYNMPEFITLAEEPDLEKIEETFNKLISRHESLRTSFHMVDNQPVQEIHTGVEFSIQYFVLKDGPRIEGGTDSIEGIIHQLNYPFNLSRAPLLRVGAVKREQQGYLLGVVMHHIISDGISHDILEKDFMALYNGGDLPRLRIQYKDFSQWQHSEKKKETARKQEQYWLNQLEGEIPLLNLPTDYRRPPLQSFKGSAIAFKIDIEETKKLKTLTSGNVTMFMVLLAIYNILLSKICNQEDIIIGIPVMGRTHIDLETVMGMFVNMLALRNFPQGEKTFMEFLTELKERTSESFENQDYQFDDLVPKIITKRDISRNPIFDTVFSFHTGSPGESKNPGPNSQSYGFNREISHFDLMLLAMEIGDSVGLAFEYSTDLFKKETIEKMKEYFLDIVKQITGNINIKLKQIIISHDLVAASSTISKEEIGSYDF